MELEGGAGGYRTSVVGQTSGGGASAESRLSVSAATYAITVGAGGAGATFLKWIIVPNGSDSVFSTITSVGGGGAGLHGPNSGGSGSNAGSNTNNDRIGRAGGSSGGSGRSAQVPTGATANQGYNGGAWCCC